METETGKRSNCSLRSVDQHSRARRCDRHGVQKSVIEWIRRMPMLFYRSDKMGFS